MNMPQPTLRKSSLTLALALLLGGTSLTCASEMNKFRSSEELDKAAAATTLAKTGSAAPAFSCVTIEGRKFDMAAQKGRVVLLAFFDPAQMHTLNAIKNDIQLEAVPYVRHWQDVEILCIGRGADAETLKTLAKERQLTVNLVADPDGVIVGKYASRFVPRFFVIDRDGKVAFEKTGSNEILGVQGMKEALSKVLQAKPKS
jgi:peroxiredoxin